MPKKRVLPYIILGILNQKSDLTGKEISNQFQNEIGEFWKATHSQIYPELKKMAMDGWITKFTKEDNEKEFYYHLTAIGQQLLTEWISEPLTELSASQDPFSLKVFFIKKQDDPELARLIKEEMDLVQQQLTHLKERKQLLFANHAAIDEQYGHYLILERAISRQEGQLAWLKSLGDNSEHH